MEGGGSIHTWGLKFWKFESLFRMRNTNTKCVFSIPATYAGVTRAYVSTTTRLHQLYAWETYFSNTRPWSSATLELIETTTCMCFCFCRGCTSPSQVPATLGSTLRTRNMARDCSTILMDPSMMVSQFTMDTLISLLLKRKAELLDKI